MFDSGINITRESFVNLDADDYKKSKYMNAQFILNPALTLDDVDALFEKYRWLDFEDKNRVVMENYWNIASNSVPYGNAVLSIMYNLTNNRNYNISENELNEFIDKKLKKEVENNVSILP